MIAIVRTRICSLRTFEWAVPSSAGHGYCDRCLEPRDAEHDKPRLVDAVVFGESLGWYHDRLRAPHTLASTGTRS
jgi:hypothetical protein